MLSKMRGINFSLSDQFPDGAGVAAQSMTAMALE